MIRAKSGIDFFSTLQWMIPISFSCIKSASKQIIGATYLWCETSGATSRTDLRYFILLLTRSKFVSWDVQIMYKMDAWMPLTWLFWRRLFEAFHLYNSISHAFSMGKCARSLTYQSLMLVCEIFRVHCSFGTCVIKSSLRGSKICLFSVADHPKNLKNRAPDHVVRGGRVLFTYRADNSYRIDKPFEMETYLDLMERSIFLYDHQKFETWDFATLKKRFSSKRDVLSEYSNSILGFIFSKSQLFSLFLAYNLIGVSCGHDFFTGMKI